MNVIIIDDERLARKQLTKLLNEYNEITIVAECANADDAIIEIEKHKPDLIFLDIQMPGKTGFELLEALENPPKVIFVTAYDEYALRAFEVNALDYILKPIEPKRLEETIIKVTNTKEVTPEEEVEFEEPTSRLSETDQIFLKAGNKCWFVSLSDIKMFESEGNYVRVYFQNNKPLILRSLNNLEKRLDPKVFFRSNRKFIINLKWIESIESWFNGGLLVLLKGGDKVEVSRRQAAKFKDLMSL